MGATIRLQSDADDEEELKADTGGGGGWTGMKTSVEDHQHEAGETDRTENNPKHH